MKKSNFIVGSSYGWTTLSPSEMLQSFQDCTKKLLALQKKHKFDTLAFSGSSGSAFAFPISIALQVPILYVRKKNERSHGGRIESNNESIIKKYLIVDDFIATGDTVKHIYNTIDQEAIRDRAEIPECMGVFLYKSNSASRYITVDNKKIPIFK